MSDQQSAVDQQKIISEGSGPSPAVDEQQRAAVDYSKVEANGKLSMRVKVHSPFRNYFDNQAFSLTAENATGPFDILPKHHNFLSLLSPCELIIRTVGEGEQRIQISGGIMHVKADRVIVFLDV